MRRRAPCIRASPAVILGATLYLIACNGERVPHVTVAGGNADRGRLAVESYGCGACHVIPGVPGARGLTGPPLNSFARHVYIAGELPNEPELLVRWIRDPPSLAPQTAMPNLGVSEATARDIAAYLYELR